MKIYTVKNGLLDNFTYLVENSGVAILIDPSLDTKKIISELGMSLIGKIRFIINTHSHYDHVVNEPFKKLVKCDVIAEASAAVAKNMEIKQDTTLELIGLRLKFILTPGHSNDSMVVLVENEAMFTGDTMFVGEIGRVDLPGSSAEQMYESLYNKIMKMNDAIKVYAGHDYGDVPVSTIGREKEKNRWLSFRSKEEFVNMVTGQ